MVFRLARVAPSSLACSACVFVAWLILQPNLDFVPHGADLDVLAYRATVPFLHVGRVAVIVATLAFLASGFGLSRSTTIIVCLLGFVANTYLFADSIVYSLYRFHLDGTILPALLRPDLSKDFGFSTTFVLRGIAYLAGLAVLHLAICMVALRYGERLGFGVALAVGAVWIGGGMWAQLAYTTASVQRDARLEGFTPALPMFRPARLSELTEWMGIRPASRSRGMAVLVERDRATGAFNYPLEPLQCSGPVLAKDERPLNLVVVLVDTLRYDTATPQIMPNLHAWSERRGAITFTDHLSGGANTSAGMLALFYGLPIFYWDAAIAAQRQPVLMDQLMANDYRFGIFVSSSLVRPPIDQTVFVGLDGIKLQAEGDGPWQRDVAATDDLTSFLAQAENRPFFSFIFYDALHKTDVQPDREIVFRPFWEQVDYWSLNQDFDPVPYLNRYRQTAHQIDEQIGRIFEALDRAGELDRTVVIVTSDHGEEFNDNRQNFWGHGSNLSRTQVQVPLLLLWPGRQSATVTYRTSHHDIPATLMSDMFGCASDPRTYSFGQNLFSSAQRRVVPLASNGLTGFAASGVVTVYNRFGAPELRNLDDWTPVEAQPDDVELDKAVLDMRTRFLRVETSGVLPAK